MSTGAWIERPWAREVMAVLCGGSTILLLLALVSYHPHDPSFFASSSGDVRNWVGPAGAQVAALLFETLGLAAWLSPLAGVAALLRQLRPGTTPWRRSALTGLALVAVSTAVLLALVVGRIRFREAALLAGGLGGELLGDLLVSLLSEIGSLVLAMTGLLVGLVLAARSPLAEATGDLIDALGQRLPALRHVAAPLRRAGTRVREALSSAARGLRWPRLRRRRGPATLIEPPVSAAGASPAEATAPVLFPEEDDDEETEPEVDLDEDAPESAPPRPRSARAASAARRREQGLRQARLPVELPPHGSIRLPPTDLLDPAPAPQPISRKEMLAVARLIERRCEEFNVEGQVTEFHPGPVVTTYEYRPNAGIKLSRITSLTDDLALALEAENVRIDRIPGRPTVGIEVPNRRRDTITLREVVESQAFRGSPDILTLGLGKSQSGEIYCAQLSKMPHLLIAGSTGSGKSVGLNAIIASVLFRARPDQVKFILIDPKMLELGVYSELPHLLVPVVTDMKLAGNALKWAVREMERRYRLLAACQVRHLDSFNKLFERETERVVEAIESIPAKNGERFEAKPLPYVVIIVDELADMLMTTGPDVVEAIARLAQKARAVGIHLVLATQRPSVDILIGAIKANFPARIAYRVASKIDSRTILDASGAERLLGSGDMLYRHPSSSRLTRVHGAWLSETECLRVVNWLKSHARAEYDESILDDPPSESSDTGSAPGGEDPLYWDAVRVVVGAGHGSTSFLQRKMKLGYSRAARIVDQLEENGILGPADGSKPRPCLVGPEYLDRAREIQEDE